MALTNGKHIVKELDGTPCTIIEEQVSQSRANFLQSLLTFNKLTVKVITNPITEGADQTYTVGVTDIVFNPVIAIYAKKLYTAQGRIVTPNMWNQISENQNVPYWTIGRQSLEIYSEELLKS
ncbi:MAG TPA: hypothetical protein PK734_06870 [Bacteroidales bacterium]|nr:MAG: hypothetical protein BWY22_02569 [Bacteroidetes bacterium ADurb.Bin217]HPM13195.1 hypothetical protein [Bacteroidales bacterium]